MITMADIAKRAGVSRSTASFVLNGREAELRISEKTRTRVLEAAQEMGYRRNGLARAIGSGKNYVFGYVKVGPSEQEARILDGVLSESARAGYLVKVLSRGSEEHYGEVSRNCVEQRLAGLVIRRYANVTELADLCEELRSYEIPVAFVDDDLVIPGATCVTSDDDMGTRLAVAHLAELGHRRIVFVAGEACHRQSRLRTASFLSALKEHGFATPPGAVLDAQWDMERVEQLTLELFQDMDTAPTAVIYEGDRLAAIGIRTLLKRGLRVPEDVSVVGYGGFSFAGFYNPSITTVAQPFEDMGRTAVRHLLSYVEERDRAGQDEGTPSRPVVPNPELLPTQLIAGESTAAPRT